MIYIVYILYIFFFNKLFFKYSKLPVFLIVLVDCNFSNGFICSISGRGNVNVKYKINNCK